MKSKYYVNIFFKSLDDVFRVTVPRSKDSEQKSYSFNQLRDLQDKLALVVGKDETDQEIIEYFESVSLPN